MKLLKKRLFSSLAAFAKILEIHRQTAEKGWVKKTIHDEIRREVFTCLLALNHARYAEEVKAGLHEKKRKGRGGKKKVAKEQIGKFNE